MTFKQFLLDSVERGEQSWIIDANTKEILDHSNTGQSVGDNWVSNVSVDIVKTLGRDIFLVHTHPDETSFSDEDWGLFGLYGHIKKMQVITPSRKVYTLERPLNYDWKKLLKKNILEYWYKIENEIFEERSKNMSIEEIVEEINQQMAKHFNIKYSRNIPSLI